MTFFSLVQPAGVLVCIVLSAMLWAQRPREPVNRALRIFLAGMAGWALCEILIQLPVFAAYRVEIQRASGLFWLPSTFWFLLFLYRFLRRPVDWLIVVNGALAAVGALAYMFTDWAVVDVVLTEWGYMDVRGPYVNHLALIPMFAGTAALWLLFRERTRTADPRAARAIRLVAVGGFVALSVAFLCNMVLPAILGDTSVPRLGSGAPMLFMPFIAVAVLRYEFLSFTTVQVAEELFEGVPEGILLVDRGQRVRRLNPSAQRMLHEADGAEPIELAERLLDEQGDAACERPVEITLPAGRGDRVLSLSVSTTARRGVDLGRIAFLRDLTEQKKAEVILRQSRDELEEAVQGRATEIRQVQKLEALAALAGGIALDFNNELAAIQGFTTAARDELPADSLLRKDLGEVLLATRRARDLVSQLLTFSRPDEAPARPLDIGKIVVEAVKMLAVDVDDEIDIDVRIGGGEHYVEGDPSQFHQVTMNLCRNALQAMKKRGGRLEVTLDRLELAAPEVEWLKLPLAGTYEKLAIRDSGIGMPPETMERIFEPFFTTKATDGTGLGLAMTWRIIRARGGTIAVESEPGEGSVFTVFLPQAESDDEEEARPSLPAVQGQGRILFVDDKEQILRLARRLLEPLGYGVDTCGSGECALELFDAEPDEIDLVISDYSMPGMSGLELARELIRRRPDLPIILISGNAGVEVVAEARKIGVRAQLDKPLSKSELASTIREVLLTS